MATRIRWPGSGLFMRRILQYSTAEMAAPWRTAWSVGIPAPSGEYSVGCVDLMHQFEGDEFGGLLVRLFYPAQLNSSQLNSPLAYAPWTSHTKYIQAYLEFQGTWGPGLITSSMHPDFNPRIPALLEASLLDIQAENTHSVRLKPKYPVVVYCHGLGGMRCDNSSICCDLASHGYVVAAVDHRDHSACASLQRVLCPGSSPERPRFQDKWIEYKRFYYKTPAREFALRNKQVRQRSREAILALELLIELNKGVEVNNMMEGTFNFKQFQGRLDVRKAAIMGHSFGGATTIQTLSEDERFLCGIALDCWMLPIHRDLLETGVNQPLLFINSFDFQWPDNVRRMMKLTYPPQHIGASACTILTLKGTNHGNQSDVIFYPLFSEMRSQFPSSLDPNTAFSVNLDICHAFFRRHLIKDPIYLRHIPNLDGGEGQSEHILLGSNVNVSSKLSQ